MSYRGAKVAWENVCLPKREGGLGIKDVDSWNKAATLKHLWHLCQALGTVTGCLHQLCLVQLGQDLSYQKQEHLGTKVIWRMLLGLEKNDEAEALGSGQGHPSYWEWQVHLLVVRQLAPFRPPCHQIWQALHC